MIFLLVGAWIWTQYPFDGSRNHFVCGFVAAMAAGNAFTVGCGFTISNEYGLNVEPLKAF